MEDRFLKAREEREATRASARAGMSELTQQRQLFQVQLSEQEAAVRRLLDANDLDGASSQVSELRRVVQDAAATLALPAHELARANGIISSIEKDVSAKRASGKPAKRFTFSSSAKQSTKVNSANTDPMLLAGRVEGERPDSREVDVIATDEIGLPPGDTVAVARKQDEYAAHRSAVVLVNSGRAAYIRDCVDCTILAVPISGSVFISGCIGCRVYVACHQLRVKDCKQLDVYVWCTSTPIIEMCTQMRFGPYVCWTGLLQSRMADGRAFGTHDQWVREVGDMASDDAAMSALRDSFRAVHDFQWLKRIDSPNWCLLPEEAYQVEEKSAMFD